MNNIYLILISLLAIFRVNAQSHEVDSLKQILSSPQHDSTKLSVLLQLTQLESEELHDTYNNNARIIAEKLIESGDKKLVHIGKTGLALTIYNAGLKLLNKGESKASIEYFQKALIIQEEIGDEKNKSNTLNCFGVLYYNLGDIPLAIDYYNKSLKAQENLNIKDGFAVGLYNLAVIYRKQGNIPMALENLRKSLKIFEEIKHYQGVSYSLLLLGEIYGDQGDHKKALEYLNKCLHFLEKTKDEAALATVNNNLGFTYNKLGDKTKALYYHQQSLKLREKIGVKSGIAMSLINIGQIYLDQGNIDMASTNFKKSLVIRREAGDKWAISNSLANLASVYFLTKNYKLARAYADTSLTLAMELGYPESISGAEKLIAVTDSALKNYLGAFEHYKKHIIYRDSLNNQRNRKASITSQLNFEFDKKEAVLKQQQLNERQIAAEKNRVQQIIIYTVFGAFILVIIFSIFIYRNLKENKKAYKIISLQKVEVENQKKIVDVKNEIIEQKQKEIIDSINYAKRIQYTLLAQDDFLKKHIPNYFIVFKPKDIVSGDFYWASKLNNGNFAFVTADSTGHGVPGAIMSLLNITSLEKAIETETSPDKILNATRTTIIERLKKDGSVDGGKDGMDCSLISINKEKTKLQIAAAHNPVWIMRNEPGTSTSSVSAGVEPVETTVIEIKANKMPVGKHDRQDESFTLHEIDLREGDIIYTLTDGFPDQFGGPNGKKFMSKKLRDLLQSISKKPLSEQKDILEQTFSEWLGDLEQIDDVTLVGIKV